jgi:hypothetical protein
MLTKHKSGFARELTVDELRAIETNSHVYVYTYGLRQALADSMASAKDAAEAEGGFTKRLRKLMEGTMSIREVTRTTNPIEVEAKRLARVDIESWVRSGKVKKPTPEAMKEWIVALAGRPAYVESATANVAEAAAKSAELPDDIAALLVIAESDTGAEIEATYEHETPEIAETPAPKRKRA